MIIRKSTEKDVVTLGAFYDEVVLWLDNHINYPKWMYKEYPSEISARAMTKEGSQYICLNGDKIVGAFVLNIDPQGNYQKGDWQRKLKDGEYMILHALAISPDCQGQGIGSKVVEFCINKAKEDGYKALRVDIVPGNIPAQKLYEKYGFNYVGDYDLDRGYEYIPLFSLFELNWD